MKVLWFTNTPSLYEYGNHHYHGGGWIESLEEIVRERTEIELAVAFFHPNGYQKVTKGKDVYYLIKRERRRKNPIRTILNNWRGIIEDSGNQKKYLKIIDDFKPDVIHVFGTEGSFALIQDFTEIPVLVHLQGLINPCVNAYFPVGYSKLDFVLSRNYLLNNTIGASPFFSEKRFRAQAKREKEIFQKVKYVCGRTIWDYQITKLFNPSIRYFHVEEVLRPIFYEYASVERKSNHNKFVILSTLSPTIYKGLDVVLRTAKHLSEQTQIEFEWRIIGIDRTSDLLKFFERNERIPHQKVNVIFLGKLNPNQVVDQMLIADVFVHPSYIDNSPNSICEAQLLGLPVIACNVGGVGSLLTHEESGVLVPSNGVFELVYYLNSFYKDPILKSKIGENAQKTAQKRHNKEQILAQLISSYNEIN